MSDVVPASDAAHPKDAIRASEAGGTQGQAQPAGAQWPTLYVLFPGTAREALEFYRSVFGGRIELYTYADFGRLGGPPDAIAHGMLVGDVSLNAADAGPDEDGVHATGLMLSILGPDAERQRTWFERLAADGRVLDPLERRPWGDWDGRVRDAYGLEWLIGFKDPEA